MNELERFVALCRESLSKREPWILDFGASWVDSDGCAEFFLKGPRAKASVEWSMSSFKIKVEGPDIVYYERSRTVDTAEEAIGRVSSLLCE